jgi:hypothetical protein
MNQKLSDWASIAEILGAAAIVVSLVFVGFQISDGNRETRAATLQSILDAEMSFQAELIRYSDVWEQAVTTGDFADAVTRRRAINLYNMAMTLSENRYEMAKAGYSDASLRALERIVRLPLYELWRESNGAQSRSEEFLELVDGMRSDLSSE